MVTAYHSLGVILDWINFTEIFLLLITCLVCYWSGKATGIQGTIDFLLHKKIITEKDLERLSE